MRTSQHSQDAANVHHLAVGERNEDAEREDAQERSSECMHNAQGGLENASQFTGDERQSDRDTAVKQTCHKANNLGKWAMAALGVLP